MSFKTVTYCIGFLFLLLAINKAHGLVLSKINWLENSDRKAKEQSQKAENIAEAAKKSVNESHKQKAQELIAKVKKNQKKLTLEKPDIIPGNGGMLANEQGVNISELLSRYNNKNFLGKESDNLSLLVFISLSMPENSLKQLAAQVRKANGVLVLRGIYQGSLKKTIRAIYELNNQGVKAIIYPELFKKYDVAMVPVFVLENKQNSTCPHDKCTRIYDKLSGNVSLKYAFEQFYEDGHNWS